MAVTGSRQQAAGETEIKLRVDQVDFFQDTRTENFSAHRVQHSSVLDRGIYS